MWPTLFGRTFMKGFDMTDDLNKGGEWITGSIGPSFQLDDQGQMIPNSPAEEPTGLPNPNAISDFVATNENVLKVGEADPVLPLFPDSSPQMIGGGDDETQKEIWEQMERGEFGAGAGSIPTDAETSI